VALQVVWTVVAVALIAIPPVSIWVATVQAERLLGLDMGAELGAVAAAVAVSTLWPLQGSIWLAWLSGRRVPGLIAGVALIVLRVLPILVLGVQTGVPVVFLFLFLAWCVNTVLDAVSVWGGTLIGASGAMRAPAWTVEGAAKTGAWVGGGALLLGGCWFVHWLLIDAAFSPRADPEQPVAFLEILPFFLILADWLVVPLAIMAPVVVAKERVAIPHAVVSALVITTWIGGWSFALQGTLAGVLWTFVVLALAQVCSTLLVIPAAYASWSMRGLAALATASADGPGEAPAA
jgi:hypothetical protein